MYVCMYALWVFWMPVARPVSIEFPWIRVSMRPKHDHAVSNGNGKKEIQVQANYLCPQNYFHALPRH